jgi:lipopolysaccharide heptosyltransferase II
LRYIGDIILTTPTIRALRKKFPNSYIAYLGDKKAITLLENNPYIDELIPFDFNWGLIKQLKFFKELRRKKFDLVIDLFGNPRSAILSFITGANTRIGGAFNWRKYLYTIPIENDNIRRTAINFHLRYLEPLDIKTSETKTEIFLKEEEKKWAIEYLISKGINLNKKIIGMHPGATWPAKQWLKENFAQLADKIVDELSGQVAITHSGAETQLAMNIFKMTKRKNIFVLDTLNLRQLASVISKFDLYVTNDCGPMHIAPAVGTRTIGLFGPGEENIWFPYPENEGYKAIRVEVECHPCHLDLCNRKGNDYMKCMKLITVEMVLNEIKKLIN